MRFLKRFLKRRSPLPLEEEIRTKGEDAAAKLRDLIPTEEAPDGTEFDVFDGREDYVRTLGLAMIDAERFEEAIKIIDQLFAVVEGLARHMAKIADVGREDPRRTELELRHLFRRGGPLLQAQRSVKFLAPLSLDMSPQARAYFTFKYVNEVLERKDESGKPLINAIHGRSAQEALAVIRMRNPWLADRIVAHRRKERLLAYLTGSAKPMNLEKVGGIIRWVAAELGAEEAGQKGVGEAAVLAFVRSAIDRKRLAYGRKAHGRSAKSHAREEGSSSGLHQ